MQVIILDDETPAVRVLRNYVRKVPSLELVLATNDAFEVLDFLNAGKQADLLFLDIEMPDITGLELLNSLQNPPLVVFTTAYEQYALSGYELDAVDYLVKPIRFERFLRAVNKAQRLANADLLSKVPKPTDSIQVKVDYQTVRINLDEITHIEGLKDYVKIYTTGKMYLTRLNLKGISQLLPEDQFLRVHRSYIVAVDKINSFLKSRLDLGGTSIPVGPSYQEGLLRRLSK